MRHFRSVLIPAVLFLLPGYASAGWVQQTSGTPNALYSVRFPIDGQTGYAVGGQGTIIKTTNGGMLWVTQSSGTSLDLYSVDFPTNSQIGYAVGGRYGSDIGVILKTTNGGASWDTLHPDTVGCFLGVHFPVGPDTGFVVGSYAGNALTLKTTNGGATWTSQILLQIPRLFSVHYPADAQTGYAVGAPFVYATILKTTNGGNQWDTLHAGGTIDGLRGVHFPIDAQTGYAVGGNLVLPGHYTVLKTSNSGASWVIQSSDTGGYLLSVHFPVDAQTGFAVGYCNATNGGWIIKTTNGGSTWVTQPLSPINLLASVYFPENAQTGYAVGGSGTILKTTDGGTWVEDNRGQGNEELKIQGIRAIPNPFVSFARVPGHASDRFALYDISGRKVGIYKGDRIGVGLSAGIYFLKPEGKDSKPLRIVKLR